MNVIVEINKKIQEHCENSKRIRCLYLGNRNIKYDKSQELMKLQDEEYKKMVFYQKLRKEIEK